MPKLEAEMNRLAGKKAIRSYARKLAEPETIKDLNITPMMDMMTIILVFLLKSFTSTSATIKLDADLSPPRSAAQLKTKEAINITVTKRIIMLEGEAIAPVNNGKVDSAVKEGGENSYTITPLVELMKKHANREKKVAELNGEKFEGQLMLVADRTTPYRLITEVLYSAGLAEYGNYRLLVLKSKE